MSSQTLSAQPSAFAVFRNRNFTLLWVAQLISVAGSAISWLAAALLVYRLTGSALHVSLILVAAALPSLLVGPIAGVFVDRFDRRRLMIAADLARAALTCAIPVLLPFGVGWLYALVLLIGAIGQFFDPAHASVLPEVASDEELGAATALIAISSQGVWALGFAIAGLVASQLAIEWAFYIDALTFLISAACIVGVRTRRAAVLQQTSVAAVLGDLRVGMRFLVQTPGLRSLFLISAAISVGLGVTNALLLPFSRQVVHATELEYSLIETLCSVGFVIGSLLMARLVDRLHEAQWLAASSIAMGIGYFMFALSPNVPAAMAVLMAYGLFSAPAVVGRQLVIQRTTPSEMRGRVHSAFFALRDVLMAAGMALAGLADVLGVRPLFIAAALVILVAGALAPFMPGLRRSAGEWRRAARLLAGAPRLPGLAPARSATLIDIDALAVHLPLLAGLGRRERQALAEQLFVHAVPSGAAIVRAGEAGDSAFFILGGRALAGYRDGEQYHLLEALGAGDFFGEIAALTGVPRTADVVAEQATTVLQVPAAVLRRIVADARLGRYLFSRMVERLARTDLVDLPRRRPARFEM